MSKTKAIEIFERTQMVVQIGTDTKGRVVTTTHSVDELGTLNSDYINEHFSDLQDSAYKRGVNDGSIDVKERVDGAYQKGFEDGKAVYDKGCEGCKYAGKVVTGQPCISCCNSYKNQWTAKQTDDEIKVGDEVEVLNSGNKYLVAWIAGTSLCGFAHDGVTCRLQPSDVRKTGRHFDVQKILEDMRK